MNPQLYFVFDVESIGLYGEGFAYGFVVVDRAGTEHAAGYMACHPEWVRGTKEDWYWAESHVFPALPDFMPERWASLDGPRYLRSCFWQSMKSCSDKGALVFADCAAPVEANFLRQCVADDTTRQWDAPYPLHDVATVLLLAGLDPTLSYERQPNELPFHNPLNDARQSARLLTNALREIDRAMCDTGGYPQ